MKKSIKIRIGRVISPVVIAILKLHTAITGTERSRIIVVNERGEVLFVRGMIGPNWSLPGGGIERHETPKQAAVRELYEETGIVIDPSVVRLIGALKGPESPVNYVAHVFYGTVLGEQLPVELYNSVEIIEINWFDLENIPNDSSSIANACLKLLSKQH